MLRPLQLALCLATLAFVGCDAGPQGRPPESAGTGVAGGRSDAPTDVCRDHDLYGDGLCDPGCLNPDPDCLDCSTAARRAVVALEDLNGHTAPRLTAEPLTMPDAGGRQLLRVLGDDVEYVVSTDIEHEEGGAFSEYCVVHGLQNASKMVQLLDGEYGTFSSEPPTELCADAAATAVINLELEAALGVLGPDGMRAVEQDADGREVPVAESRIDHVNLVGVQSDRELLRVHVERRNGWPTSLESYLVNTRIRRHDGEMTCEVLGLQNKTHQVDMR